MAERAPRTFTVLAASEISDDRLQWIEVMPTADKARNGPFHFTVTRDDLATYAAFIEENGDRIVVDYDHEGADGGSTKAAGWFTGKARVIDTDDRGPILEAEIEWTPQGLEDVQSKRFRFISPEFNFQERDQKTGLMSKAKQILAATLTNRPFFAELAAVAAEQDDLVAAAFSTLEAAAADTTDEEAGARARELLATLNETLTSSRQNTDIDDQGGAAASTEEEDMDLKVLAATLGLPEDADMEAVVAAVAEHTQRAAEAAELEAERKRIAARKNTTGGSMPNEELIAALGLSDDADEAQVLAAVRRTKTASDRLEQLEQENERLTATAAGARKLEERVKSLEAERRQEQVDQIISDGIRSGRVVPAEKAALAKQFATNPSGLREIVEARPEHLFALAGRGSSGGDLEEGDDVISVKAQFQSVEADGVDTDSARVHVRAMQILREQGKSDPTEAEYADAVAKASDPVYSR